MTLSLYQALLAAEVTMSSHESDLYFERTPESLAILALYPVESSRSSRFVHQVLHTTWIEVPFAYAPWWEGKR